MGYSSEAEVEELESEYDDSEDISDSPWSPFRSILDQEFTFTPSSSFMYDDFESEWEVGWRRTPRMNRKAVDAMPTVKIDRSINCPICLEEFAVGEEAKEMPCKHHFHRECIVPWLEKHSSCPLCRFQMPADELEDLIDATDGDDGDTEDGGDYGGDDSSRRESGLTGRLGFGFYLSRLSCIFFPPAWLPGNWNSYSNESDDDDDDDDDDDSSRIESGLNGRWGFRSRIARHSSLFSSLWSQSDGNSYSNGSDGGNGNRVQGIGYSGGSGRRQFRLQARWCSTGFFSSKTMNSYTTKQSFSSTPRGNFSWDASKGFSCGMSRSAFQGMHSRKLGGFNELDEYNTTAMRTSRNGRSYIFKIYRENWVNPPGKTEDNLWRDFAFRDRENLPNF